MRKFNENDFELVKSYEKDFRKAVSSRYCSALVKEELDVVAVIYKECLNRQANLSCGGCILQMMTSVGRLYFAYKEKMEKEEEIRKQKELEAQKKEEENKENKPKKRRRKKNETETED